MPEGVDGECACNPATWAAIANAKSVTASGPSSGNASACSRDNSPRLAASRMTPSSGNWVTAIRISDVYHARPGGAMPDKRRTMTFPEILMESLQTGEVLPPGGGKPGGIGEGAGERVGSVLNGCGCAGDR